MSQNLPPNKTVAFAGHKCDKLQKGLYDDNALDSLARQIESSVKDLYNSGFTNFIYTPNDKFGIIASEAVLKLREQHGEITLRTIPESVYNHYYNVIKYLIENASVVVYCDGDKEEPQIEIMNKM